MKTFKELRTYLTEGNPLSRVASFKGHSAIFSPERKHLTPKENAARMKELKGELRNRGFGFRKTKGKWDEGGGVGSENSLHVFARGTSDEHGKELLKHVHELSTKYDQDAYIHRTPDGKGTAIYTGTARKGEKDEYGPTRYGQGDLGAPRNPYGETEYQLRRPEKKRRRITFMPKD